MQSIFKEHFQLSATTQLSTFDEEITFIQTKSIKFCWE